MQKEFIQFLVMDHYITKKQICPKLNGNNHISLTNRVHTKQ